MGEICVEVGGVAKVLCGDEVVLCPGGPFVALEKRGGGFAWQVEGPAGGEELRDAIVLAAKGEQRGGGVRERAGLNQAAEELSALR